MEEVKFKAIGISLNGGETWVDVKPSKYESWLQEPIHARPVGGEIQSTFRTVRRF